MHTSSRTRPETQDPLFIIADGILCRLRVWSEAEWDVLPDDRRPLKFLHVRGLGWVGAEPIAESASLSTAPAGPDRCAGDRRPAGRDREAGPSRRERRCRGRRRVRPALATVGAGRRGDG